MSIDERRAMKVLEDILQELKKLNRKETTVFTTNVYTVDKDGEVIDKRDN